MGNAQLIAEAVFALTDTMDARKAVSSMTENCTFTFASQSPVSGRTNVQTLLANFFGSIGAIRHEILEVFENGDTIITEVNVHYTRLDGSELMCPATTIWRMQADEILDYRIFMDASALYSLQQEQELAS